MSKQNETAEQVCSDDQTCNKSQAMSNKTPIGVFWDIENCPVPRGKSALSVAQHIRDKFFKDHREAEFMCVCDTSKENKDVIEELNHAQVTVVHINATSKNAADDKLRQCLRRFAHAYTPPVTVILMSGDVNFATELSDLRHRYDFFIILIHKRNTKEALLTCAHECHVYEELVSTIPCKSPIKAVEYEEDTQVDLLVANLPSNRDYRQIKNRLQMLSDNCGGRVQNISRNSALVHFSNHNLAERAKKRMNGEDVYGFKIRVTFATSPSFNASGVPSPLKQKALRKAKMFGSPSKFQRPQPIKPRISSPNQYPPMPNGHFRPWRPPKQYCNYNTNYYPPTDSYYPPPADHYSYRGPRPPYPEPLYPEPYYGHSYQLRSGQPQDDEHGLKNVVDRFKKEQRTSREVLFLQQQIYQEEQEQHNSTENVPVEEYDSQPPCDPRTPTNKIPFNWNCEENRLSPHFRRTPGSKRPPSRCSNSNRSSPVTSSDTSSSFQPIRNYSPVSCESDTCSSGNFSQGDGQGVELMISNLDYNIRGREWKKILFTEFQQHVKVLGVYIHGQPDNTNIAYVKLSSVDDARYAISQFHRKKIGYKRIHVNLVNSETPQPTPEVKQEVAALLKEVPDCTMPVFKCLELYEKRYQKSLCTAELYRMRDTVEVCDDTMMGRVVILVPELQALPPPAHQTDLEKEEPSKEGSVCKVHCREGSSTYLEYLERPAMPNVVIQLRSFATHVHSMLQSHDGGIPFNSFIACYTAEFGQLRIAPGNEGGVPLEYLITCVPGIEIVSFPARKIQWAKNKLPDLDVESCSSTGAAISQQLSQFCKEVVELLRCQKHCQLLFSKFIPTYHQHFNRQCRVADYGFTKLLELFVAIPHVVQMIGLGSQRYVTLAHEAQVRRFSCDIMRVLKSCASRQIDIIFLPNVYRSVIGREFDITDYGVCYIEDMLNEIPESNIAVAGVGAEMVLSIRRRDQTPAEIERTKQFASEVVDLLKTNPGCKMLFKKFIPAYHHHFGRQCRVSDYGVAKLVELFELIPQIVQIYENDGEKHLKLTEPELVRALGEQVGALLQQYPDNTIPMPEFLSAFMKCHGYGLQLQDYGASSVAQLIEKIPHVAEVADRDGWLVIRLNLDENLQQLSCRLLLFLMDSPGGSLRQHDLLQQYYQKYGDHLNMKVIVGQLDDVIQVIGEGDKALVKLMPLQQFAVDMCTLLCQKRGQLHLTQIEAVYAQYFGVSLVPAAYGYPSVVAMLEAIPHMVTIHGKGMGRVIVLNNEFRDRIDMSAEANGTRQVRPSIPSESGTDYQDEEEDLLLAQASRQHNMDLLNQPVPSAVPSPELQPYAASEPDRDFIRFDKSPVSDALCMTEEEKRAQWTPLCRTPVSEMLQFAAQLLPTDVSRKSPSLESGQSNHPGWMKDMLQAAVHHKPMQRNSPTMYNMQSPPEIVSGMVNGSAIKPTSPCMQQVQHSMNRMQLGSHVASIPSHLEDAAAPIQKAKAAMSKPASSPALLVHREASQDSLNMSSVSSGTSSPSKTGTPRRRRIAAKFTVQLDDQ